MDLLGAKPSFPPPVPQPQRRQRRAALRPSVATPRLSLVIVNYCDWEGTAALARQVLRTPQARRGLVEVVVVDNHSPAHRLTRRMRRWPGLSLRRWRRNQGFARAANEGCRLSRGDWFLILNPDVSLPLDFLDRVLPLLDEVEPRVGVVGCRLHNSDGTPQLSSGPAPTFAGTLLRLTLPRARRKYAAVAGEARCAVPWVTGCCLLVRKECLRELGGFDPRYFLYYEDVDLCRRAAAAGWTVCFEPRLSAVHHRPLHSRPVPAYLRVLTRHALLTYAARHWPVWQGRLLARLVRVEAGVRCWWARWHGKQADEKCFATLERIGRALTHGRRRRARHHLLDLVRQHDA